MAIPKRQFRSKVRRIRRVARRDNGAFKVRGKGRNSMWRWG